METIKSSCNNPASILLDVLLRAGWSKDQIDMGYFNEMIRACDEVVAYPPAEKTDEFSFELRPSIIHGVGVFTRHFILEGIRLDLWGDENAYRVTDLAILRPAYQKELIDRYSVDGRYPMFFNRLAIGCYLNHADYPNVESRENDQIYTLRPIPKGTELTIDYKTLKEKAPNAR